MKSRPHLAGQTALLRREALLRMGWLKSYPWLVHAFTTRWFGNLSYGVNRAESRTVVHKRQQLLRALRKVHELKGSHELRLVTLRQLHSDMVRVVGDGPLRAQREPDGAIKLVGDALITAQPGLVLAVQVADCLPILLVDPVRRVVANVHAGWRGTLARVAEKTVGQMRLRFRSKPRQLLAVIGPGIHGCCYEVGPEVFEAYLGQFAWAKAVFQQLEPSPTEAHWHPKVTGRALKPWPTEIPPQSTTSGGAASARRRYFLDLVEANRRQLRAAGLEARNIFAVRFCTACRTDLFFSHRAEAARTGRQMGLVGIAPQRGFISTPSPVARPDPATAGRRAPATRKKRGSISPPSPVAPATGARIG